MTKNYYVAGPMRGYPEFNFLAFFDKAKELRNEGHTVYNPAERDMVAGFDPTGLKGTMAELHRAGFDLREALADDTSYICREATHLYMLPGWSQSKGATAERALAVALGLVIEGAEA